MADRPIIFSAPMVRALLAGRKTQTRRLLKVQPPRREDFSGSDFGMSRCVADGVKMYSQNDYDRLPKHPTDWELLGSVGVAREAGFPKRYRVPFSLYDRLWVREAHAFVGGDDPGLLITRADYPAFVPNGREGVPSESEVRWRPSIHMSRSVSRLTLDVTDVRVQRLQDISEEDAIAEGVTNTMRADGTLCWTAPKSKEFINSARFDFAALWQSIHGDDAWVKNSWVVAISFDVRHGNIDSAALCQPVAELMEAAHG